MVLSTAYCPPIEFFALLARNSVVYLEAHEHYCKQSWRNRCRILTSTGVMDLNFPVIHGADLFHTRITDVRVDYSTDWVRRTEYAIETAYYSSPFFIYYRDELFGIFDAAPERLWDLNMALILFFCRKIGIAPEFRLTEEFKGPDPDLSPKRSSSYVGRQYWQVFKNKFGFVPNLSVMDLLFNEGPESLGYLY